MIKVLFDATILNNIYTKSCGRSGIFWTAFNLLKSLNLRKDVRIYLYSQNPIITKKFITDYATELPNVSLYFEDIKDIDICFSSVFAIPEAIKKTGISCFILIHDCLPLIFPQYFGDYSKNWFAKLFNSLNNDDYCFSNSEHTKKDFLRLCPRLDANKIITIPLSTNLAYKPNKILTATVRKKYNIPTDKKYLFSLCSLEPRKNLIRAVRTFIRFIEKNHIEDLVFVLGGGAWKGFIERFEKEVPDFEKYKDKIIRAGYVDDEDMEVLYSNAEWFVYTSQYEGFGMPPLEAMACGTAVITSNNSSLPEVVGDAGIMINWDSDEEHIAAYEKYYFDKKFRDQMARKGLKRSKLFSWKRATDIMVEQFKKCPQNPNRTSLILKNFYKTQAKKSAHTYIVTVKLFNFLPLFGYKRIGGRRQWKIFGLPILKIRKMDDAIITKYYILGLPVVKAYKIKTIKK
ncbi:MAG: glycosyltransferase family 4 protein [Alphaproteobacteria bacterium]|nr:glycosyltransferase family 4 protein [Alphaproteobacteria bacterium]